MKTPNAPTARQIEILTFIARFQRINGFVPTRREVGTRFGIASTNGVQDHMHALLRKGLVHKWTKKARTLLLTAEGQRLVDASLTVDEALS
jgi:repressor LexA